MKKMKMVLMTAMLGVATLSMVFTSCNPDECKDVVCENGGVCSDIDGSCDCAAGYEGANCETLSRAKMIGDWAVEEDGSNSVADQYDVEIKANSNLESAIYISNVYNAFANDVDATVAGNVITILRQEPDGDGFFVVGSGTIDTTLTPNRINVNYTVTNESDPLNILTDDFGTTAGSYSEWDRK